MSDARLIAAYCDLLSRRVAGDRKACVAPEKLLALVRRELPEADRLVVLDHVMACAPCLNDFELLRSVERGRRGARVRWPSPQALALAASLAVVAGGGVLWQLVRGRGEGDVLRGGEAQVSLVAPVGATPAAEAHRLIWRTVAGAADYQVEVLDPDGTAIYAGAAGDTVLVLPDSVSLASGLEYRWWVRARFLDGSGRRATPQSFVVR